MHESLVHLIAGNYILIIKMEDIMTPLRQQTIDYMSSKDFSENDVNFYINCIADLAMYYNKSPDKLSHDEVQEYLLYLLNHKNMSQADYNNVNTAIQFFYNDFLKNKAINASISNINQGTKFKTFGKNSHNPFYTKMLNEMKFRRLSESTIKSYVNSVNGLAEFYNIPLEQISNEEIQDYLLYLQEERGLAWNTCNIAASGLLFFYNVVANRDTKLNLPVRKHKQSLPEVLSQPDVELLLNSVSNMKERIILMTAYSAGLRVSELVNLRFNDIDSQRMTIRIVDSKGNKDRYTILSSKLLKTLRNYYLCSKPENYLFPSKDLEKKISTVTAQRIYTKTKIKAKITKGKGIHTLRHSFATHMYESGVDIRIIQKLLGHKSIQSTLIYTHISHKLIEKVKSPLDSIEYDKI